MDVTPSCYQEIIEKFSNGILLLDEECQVHLWNHFLVEHSGVAADEIVGKSLFEIFPEVAEPWFRGQIKAVINAHEDSQSDWNLRPHILALNTAFNPVNSTASAAGDSGKMYQNCQLFAVANHEGEKKLACMVVIDVTKSALYQIRLSKTLMTLEQISRMDGLTGLYNRAYWEGRLGEEFARSRRYPDNADMSLLMFDIDHFKKVNDLYGHLAGDQVLIELSRLVQDMFRNIDIPGRYGGEEFAVVLPKTALPGALIAANRLLEKVAAYETVFEGVPIKVTISIGLAQFSAEMKGHGDLIALADEALYNAKREGRNQVKIYDETNEASETY